MKVNIKGKSGENNAVLLEDDDGTEQWFPLADNVDMKYVSIGKAEVTISVDEDVTYIKMEKKTPKAGPTFGKPQKTFGGNFGKPKPNEEPQEEKKFYKTKHIVLEGLTAEELRAGLDKASEMNWVIATQTHFIDGKWYAVIYYKVKPE